MKQTATPSPSNATHSLQRSNPNALQRELIRHIDEDATMSSFDIGLQFLDSNRMTYAGQCHDASFWTENASIEWNERQTPFHTVGRLTLLANSQLSPKEDNATYIDVTRHATAESAPVGSINRARWRAEAASRQARGTAD